MESLIAPNKTLTTPKIPEKPERSKNISRNSPLKLTNDAYLKRLCKLGRLSEAISYLDSCFSVVSHSTLSHLIESCIDSNSLELCYKLHARVRNLVRSPDPFLQTKLLSMYAKCGALVDAFAVFNEMPERNLYTWSAIIGACCREKWWNEVVDLFYEMMADGDVIPDEFLFPKILQACGNSRDVESGRLIHGMVIKLGMSGGLRVNNSILAVYAKCGWLSYAKKFFETMEMIDRVSWNAIITGYCDAGKIEEAQKLIVLMRQGLEPDVITWNVLISRCYHFGKCDLAMTVLNEMESCRVKPDVFTWTSMILGLAQNNRRLEALRFFNEMLLFGVEPNDVALMSAISVCSMLKDVRKGKEVHSVAIKFSHSEDVLVGNSLVDMYSKCGNLESARLIFDTISNKDVCTWNSMIGAYYQGGYCSVAHDLFKQMQESDVLPNVITLNVMITGYVQNGDEDQAMDLFNNMERKWGVKPNTASWNAVIAGYVHCSKKNKAFGMFRKMQSLGVNPNSVTILSVLPACANLVAAKKVREIHCCVLRNDLVSEISVLNSLIDMYAKSGNIHYSRMIFDRMSLTDIITWNTMVNAYVLHGCSRQAIEIFERLRKLEFRPNRSTFVSMISAYGLARMVDEGKSVFTSMTDEYKILPCLDHYVAMVNLYGRSGNLNEAYDFIRGMSLEPGVSIWSAFLMACCRHKHVKLAIHASQKLLELEPDNIPVRRLLSKLYGLCRIPGKTKGAVMRKYSEGCSWIEEENVVHTFVTGHVRQMDGESLYSWMVKSKESKDDEMISIEEEENETVAGFHSEKLALAFVLTKSNRAVGGVRIVKNLRMCDHCHSFAKLISKTNGCEIYINDSVWLHHFKDGICSCGDYW